MFLKELKIAWGYFVLGKRPVFHVTPWVAPPPLDGKLWFGDLLVADLHQMAPHQGTWFSEYDLRIASGEGELQERLLAYIAFCEDFHRRIAEGPDHDFDEFDRFGFIPYYSSWNVILQSGCSVPMEGRLWFADGDLAWQHPEAEPSKEAAACEFWVREAGAIHGSP